MKRGIRIAIGLCVGVALGLGAWAAHRGSLVSFFVTPDQQGDCLLRRGRPKGAAVKYTDPMRQGVAWYRAGEFKDAAKAFARVPGAAGAFNEGNAFLMHGAYDDAVTAYDRALNEQPGWTAAEENRAIAVARRDRVKREGGDSTGGKIDADGVVFDLNKKGGQEIGDQGATPMSDAELNGLWLRRVQTTPGDFLRAKFAYQAARKGATP